MKQNLWRKEKTKYVNQLLKKKSILGGAIMQLVKTKNVKSIVETLEASISDFMNSEKYLKYLRVMSKFRQLPTVISWRNGRGLLKWKVSIPEQMQARLITSGQPGKSTDTAG